MRRFLTDTPGCGVAVALGLFAIELVAAVAQHIDLATMPLASSSQACWWVLLAAPAAVGAFVGLWVALELWGERRNRRRWG